MNNKPKIELEQIRKLRENKMSELFGTKNEKKKKKKNYTKIILKTILKLIIFSLILSIIGAIVFLSLKYFEYKMYIENNKELLEYGLKYEKQQKMKKDELKELSQITLDNIDNLPEDKKELMFNLIPSGSPLTREVYITSEFGTRVHPTMGITREHHGIDLRVDIGDDIISPAIGTVIFVGQQGGYGNVVKIRHFDRFQTVYAHLSKIVVKNGQLVGKGQKIAEGGNTGISTGPHLHYEIRYNDVPINPKNFINWDKENFKIVFEKERRVQWDYFLTIMGKH